MDSETSSNPVKASLFVTCLIDQLHPQVRESVVSVLRKLGVTVSFPSGQTCCGQPAFNSGFWNESKVLAKRFLKIFRGDEYIVVPSGSCASMLRVFYSELFHDEPEQLKEIEDLSSRVYEFSEFIVDVLKIKDLSPYVKNINTTKKYTVTYHEACHLRRELGVLTQPRTLIKSLPSVQLIELDQSEVCCGFGGAFSIKYPEISAAMLQDKIDRIQQVGADAVVANDISCLIQMSGGLKKQGLKQRSIHLAQLCNEVMSSN